MKYDVTETARWIILSPPSRGAWIEMPHRSWFEGSPASPPSRGAWIEMTRKSWMQRVKRSRPPRGGRGLKSVET